MNRDEALADPYSYAVDEMRKALEFALDDGVSDAMNDVEYANLEQIARTIMDVDPAVEILPRPG